MRRLVTLAALLLMPALSPNAFSQGRQDSATLISAQRKAIDSLAFMDGVWRGPAWTVMPSGEKHSITQTERIGAFLDGSIKVIEGRGYDKDDKVTFNALGIISYDPVKHAYSLRSYAQGRSGDFPLTLTADGYTWQIPMGSASVRYTAVVKNGTWHEVGDRITPDNKELRFFDMTLKRVGDSGWPSDGAVSPR